MTQIAKKKKKKKVFFLNTRSFFISDGIPNPMAKFRQIKQNVLDLPAREKIDMVQNVASMFLMIVGCTVTKRGYEKTYLTGLTGYVLLDCYVLAFYSAYYYRHKYTLIIQSLLVIGISMPVSC